MVCDGARAGNRALDHIQPVHGRVRPRDAPPVCKVARIAEAARTRAEEVGVKREDDVRAVEFIDGVDVLTESQAGAFQDPIAPAGLVLVPPCQRELREQLDHQVGECRRGRRLREDVKPRAFRRCPLGAFFGDRH